MYLIKEKCNYNTEICKFKITYFDDILIVLFNLGNRCRKKVSSSLLQDIAVLHFWWVSKKTIIHSVTRSFCSSPFLLGVEKKVSSSLLQDVTVLHSCCWSRMVYDLFSSPLYYRSWTRDCTDSDITRGQCTYIANAKWRYYKLV